MGFYLKSLPRFYMLHIHGAIAASIVLVKHRITASSAGFALQKRLCLAICIIRKILF